MQVATRWDGAFYLDIARYRVRPGRHRLPEVAVLPAPPGPDPGARARSPTTRSAIFVVNQLLFLVALAGVYRLPPGTAGPRSAQLSVWSLALFPASFVFSMTYPSAIFLAASVWAFVLVEDEHDLAAGLVARGFGPGASERPGAGRGARGRGAMPWRRVLRGRRSVGGGGRSRGASTAADRTGDPLVFLTTKSRWQEITFVGLFEGHVKWSVLPHVVAGGRGPGCAGRATQAIAASRGWCSARSTSSRRCSSAWSASGATPNECFPPFVGDRPDARAVVAAGARRATSRRRPSASCCSRSSPPATSWCP